MEERPTQQPDEPVRIALLGAGIFATNSHAPFLHSHPEAFYVVAVWSRRPDPAEALARTFEVPDHRCRPDALSGQDDLRRLLDRPDVDAVSIVLPLDVQPSYVLRALAAGKHVLSEKPIAPTVQEGRRVLEEYVRLYRPRGLRWSVAENFRYEPALIRAAEAVRDGEVGRPLTMTLAWHAPFRPGNPYLKTAWRSDPSYEGGLFVDAFVHGAAAMRVVAGEGAGMAAKSVFAIVNKEAAHIPGPDTLSAVIEFGPTSAGDASGEEPDSGEESRSGGSKLLAVVSATYASEDRRFELAVTGTGGRVEIRRVFGGDRGHGYEVAVASVAHDGQSSSGTEFHSFEGIEGEYSVFLRACRGEEGRDAERSTPEEALADLALVEAALSSHGSSVPIQWQDLR